MYYDLLKATVTFSKAPRKPNEEEETKLGKSVTPEQAPPNARKEEISWKRIGVTPDDAHPGGGGGTKSGRQSHTRMRTPEKGGGGGGGTKSGRPSGR